MNNFIDFNNQELMGYFNRQPSSVKGQVNSTTLYYKRVLYNLLYSVFEWNLPKEWKENYFRYWLYRFGSIGVVYTNEYGWVCQPYSIVKLDLYYQPKVIQIYNQFITKPKVGVIGENAEIIKAFDDFYGFDDIIMCDRQGAIYEGREGLNWIKEEMAEQTNLERKAGSLADMLAGADVFIGVSAPGTVTTEMVKTMNEDAIVFACANPTPEIFPEEAKAGGARVIATGRSDYPNQINNVLAFPGVFRGTFDVRASDINEEMKLAAAKALAELASDRLCADYIIPSPLDPRVVEAVAAAVAQAARDSGVARL